MAHASTYECEACMFPACSNCGKQMTDKARKIKAKSKIWKDLNMREWRTAKLRPTFVKVAASSSSQSLHRSASYTALWAQSNSPLALFIDCNFLAFNNPLAVLDIWFFSYIYINICFLCTNVYSYLYQ